MKSRAKASVMTMVVNIGSSILFVFINMIYTNCIITNYGSKANGLISTLTQFVSFFSILEGGITTAATVAMYEPVVKHDYNKLNAILSTTKIYFERISFIISGIVIVIGIIYIRFIETPYSYLETFTLLLCSLLVMVTSLLMSKYNIVLQGYNKAYLTSLVATITKLVTWSISIVLIELRISIIWVYFCNLLNVLLNYIWLSLIIKFKYKHINYTGKYNRTLIAGSNDVLFQKIASTVFSSTDLVLVSACINLEAASVYNLYTLIFKSVFTLLDSVVQAPFNSFGQIVKESREKTIELFSIYRCFVEIIATTIFVSAAIVILPFLSVYTREISDYSYIYPSLAILFFCQYYAQIINRPYGLLLNITGNFKMQNTQCLLSAVINLIISVLFMKWFGMQGIVFGSFIGTLTIVIFNMIQVNRNIIRRNVMHGFGKLCMKWMISLVLIYIGISVAFRPNSYLDWIVYSISTIIIMFIIECIIYYIFERTILIKLIKYLISFIKMKA